MIDGHGPTRAKRRPEVPGAGSHSCAASEPDLARVDPLPSSGTSVTGPAVAIRRTRPRTHHGHDPQSRTRRHPPDQPGYSCNPRPPARSTPEVPYMSPPTDPSQEPGSGRRASWSAMTWMPAPGPDLPRRLSCATAAALRRHLATLVQRRGSVAGHDDLRRRAPLIVNRHHETAAAPALALAGSGLALMVPASGGDDDAPAKQGQTDTGRSHGEPGRARG